MRNVCLALLFLLCAACARFENPIVAEDGPALDEALIGHWLFENPDGTFEMEISRNGKEGHVVTTVIEEGKAPQTEKFRLVTARLARLAYASITGGKDAADRWLLFRYELNTPDRLTIYQDNDKFWEDAISNKVVSGTIDSSGKVRIANVTASSEELRTVVFGYGSVIFDDAPLAEFTRLPAD